MTFRYDIDYVDGDFYIFDNTRPKSSIVYMLMSRRVHEISGYWQITLAVYDASRNIVRDYYVFERELWTTKVYVSSRRRLRELLFNILETLELLNIENPIELANAYGGQVLGADITMPVRPLALVH